MSQEFRIADQARKLSGKRARGIRAAVVEPQPGRAIFDIIVKAAQIRHDRGAAGGHGFQRRQPERLAGFGEAWINEDAAASIFADQRILIEDRAQKFASDAELLRERP